MKNLSTQHIKTPTPKDLEELLIDFTNYGSPRFHHYEEDNTWACAVNMRVISAGTSFEVKSDYLNTPLEAVVQCRKRMFEALGNLNK